MFEKFLGLFKRKTSKGYDWNISMVRGAKKPSCPCCGSTDVYKGPFTNVTCVKCGALLNLTPFGVEIVKSGG